ncbi:MAG: ATP-binding cassette domain-containing protein [Candidatus Paceibacterota bacterium]
MFLSCKNLSFSYSPKEIIINNISFDIEKGKTLVIVGSSGSGKSTILRLIAGILPSQRNNIFSGDILINSESHQGYLNKNKLSFMFQDPALLPNISVYENIEIPLKIIKTNTTKNVDEIIDVVGLKKFKNFLPKDLSGGMKTRVSLVRSFITNPEILLLDEPFSSLDTAWKNELYLELSKLKSELKTTVVLVTHDINKQ